MFKGLTRDEWLELVSVDFDTGIVRWKPKGVDKQPDTRLRNSWNKQWSGKEVGTIANSRGKLYKLSVINNKGFRLHQLVYFLAGNSLTDGLVIDHINGDSLDNRLSNLRLVTQAENNRNVKVCRKDSVTGVKGIYYNASYKKSDKKFVVKTHHHKKQYHLGRYKTLDEAYEILAAFKKKMGLPIPEYNGNPATTLPPNPL